VWPPEVETIAAPLRAAGIEARLEELAPGEDEFPGAAATAVAYRCGGGLVVALVPADRDADSGKVGAAAGCEPADQVPAPPFPYRNADRVLLEQRLLAERTVWLEAGSPRHVLGLDPTVLRQLTRAIAADLTQNGGG
jgi:prolyl-tRNA editing enzyme YbaK/EbsC (Cys-tRNA(Pro) deacylase)